MRISKKVMQPDWFRLENYKQKKLLSLSLLDWLIQFEIRFAVRREFIERTTFSCKLEAITNSEQKPSEPASVLAGHFVNIAASREESASREKQRQAKILQEQKDEYQRKIHSLIGLIQEQGIVDPEAALELIEKDDLEFYRLKWIIEKKCRRDADSSRIVGGLNYNQLQTLLKEIENQYGQEQEIDSDPFPEWKYSKPIDLHQRHGIIKVPLELPDHLLVEQFKAWLKLKRKEISPAYHRRRQKTWVTCYLLPVLDLKHWIDRNNLVWTTESLIKIASNRMLDRGNFERTTSVWLKKVLSAKFLSTLEKAV